MSNEKLIPVKQGVFPAAWVAARMEDLGFTRANLIVCTRRNKQTVSTWFMRPGHGHNPPKARDLVAMADMLGCRGGVLLGTERPRVMYPAP